MAAKKRRLDEESQGALQDVLRMRGVSERATHEIWNRLRPQETLRRSQFLEEVEVELAPWKHVLFTREFQLAEGDSIQLPMVNLKGVLEKLVELPDFAKKLSSTLQGAPSLTPIIYCDECTAGNVLAVDKNRKCSLWHLSWIEFGYSLERSQAWIPHGSSI